MNWVSEQAGSREWGGVKVRKSDQDYVSDKARNSRQPPANCQQGTEALGMETCHESYEWAWKQIFRS